jgi:hypothetical protein
MARIKERAVALVARKKKKPAHATGPDMMTDGTSQRNK